MRGLASAGNPAMITNRSQTKGFSMQLVGMLDSPYVRRAAVTLLTAGVAFQHRAISLFRDIDEFSKISPLLKAPTLVADDGGVLVESNVILDYLATLSPAVAALTPRALPAFRATGLALTILEKAVQIHYERELRASSERSESWTARIDRQLKSAWRRRIARRRRRAGSAAARLGLPTSASPAPSASRKARSPTSSIAHGIRGSRPSAGARKTCRRFARRRRSTG
jgi:glutathione S-transferase